MVKTFTEAFTALTALTLNLTDHYLRAKLVARTQALLTIFLEWRQSSNVAQCKERRRLLRQEVCNLLELISLLRYLGITLPRWSLAAQLRLLRLDLAVVTWRQKLLALAPTLSLEHSTTRPRPVTVRSKIAAVKPPDDTILSQKITTFLSNQAGSEVRAITAELGNQFSSRTVRRYLNRMVKAGQLRRDNSDKAARYFVL